MRHFDRGHLYRVALPMGGIGTGTVSLSGRGELCDWEIMNIPNKGALCGECEAKGRSFFAAPVMSSPPRLQVLANTARKRIAAKLPNGI